MVFHPYGVLLFLVAAFAVGFIIFLNKDKKTELTYSLTFMLSLAAIWSVSYGLELSFVDIQTKLLTIRFQYLAIPYFGMSWFIFVYVYLKDIEFGRRDYIILGCMLLIPTIATVLAFSGSELPHIYTGYDIAQDMFGTTQISPNYNFVTVLSMVYSYIIVVITTIIIIHRSIRTDKMTSTESSMLLICTVPVMIGNLIGLLTDAFGPLDITPVTFFIAIIALIYLIYSTTINSLKTEYMKLTLERETNPIIYFDKNGKILSANKSAFAMLDIRIRRKMNLIKLQNELSNIGIEISEHERKIVYTSKSNKDYIIISTPLFNSIDNFIGMVAHSKDITDKKGLRKQVQELSYLDSMTGLPNAKMAHTQIERAINLHGDEPLLLMGIRISILNRINSVYGYNIGDVLMEKTSQKLQKLIPNEGLIARWQHDQFLICMPISSKELGKKFSEILVSSLNDPIVIDDNKHYLNPYFGTTFYPDNGKTADELLKNTSFAIESAIKHEGINYEHFNKLKADEENIREKIARDLHQAVKNNQFALQYDPIIDYKNNSVAAFEAGVRWDHPKMGVIMPEQLRGMLIQANLENKLSGWLSEWMITKSFSQIKAWKDSGVSFNRINMTIPLLQFGSNAFVVHIRKKMMLYRINAKKVQFDIIGADDMKFNKQELDNIHKIRSLGFRISIQSKGFGWEAINNVNKFNLKGINITKQISAGMYQKDYYSSMIKGLAEMCKEKKYTMVVQKVLHRDQLDKFRDFGCNYFQGNFFTLPLKAESVGEFVKRKDFISQRNLKLVDERA